MKTGLNQYKDINNPPFFSIIIPVYNTSKYIAACLNSILSQTFQDFEIILVNDGSTDDSGTICDNYAIDNECIKVVHKTNSGTASARNTGLQIAQGEYIWFVDCDDLIKENSLSDLREFLEEYKNISVLNFTKVDFKDQELNDLIISFPEKINTIIGNTGKLIEGVPSSVCFSIYERKLLIDKGLKFEEDNIFEDEFFNLKLYTNYSFQFLNTNLPLYLYRKGNQQNKTSLKDIKSLYEKCLSKIKLFQYVSQIEENSQNTNFLEYKKRVYAEYALYFLELCLRQKEIEHTKRIIAIIKENIPKIPVQGSYFKTSQIKRLIYNLSPHLLVAYIKFLIMVEKEQKGN